MNPRRLLSVAVLLLFATPATAQITGSATILEWESGKYIGFVKAPDGTVTVMVLTDLTVIKHNPPQPPSPVAWKVTGGLHVLIVDDENLRGNLPQSQVNIFTSKPLKDWLTANAKAYRFSSNDSLKPGQPARELERPEFVAGWDLVSDAVEKRAINLPAWIVSDGRKQILGALPDSVEAVTQKLGEFK